MRLLHVCTQGTEGEGGGGAIATKRTTPNDDGGGRVGKRGRSADSGRGRSRKKANVGPEEKSVGGASASGRGKEDEQGNEQGGKTTAVCL